MASPKKRVNPLLIVLLAVLLAAAVVLPISAAFSVDGYGKRCFS